MKNTLTDKEISAIVCIISFGTLAVVSVIYAIKSLFV